LLKLIAIGVWVILVTAGATFASVYLGKSSGNDSATKVDLGTEEIVSDLTSIPVIHGGDVEGYVILQLSFEADKAILEKEKVEPLPYLKDAAFRVIFTSSDIDFRHLKSGDLDRLTDMISKEANHRFGTDLVRQVLFQQINYVRKEDIRTNWIGNGNASN